MASFRGQDSLGAVESKHEEDLSHEQMKDILQKADMRMRAAIRPDHLDDNIQSLEDMLPTQNIPNMSNGSSIPPYITTTNGIAHSDPARMLQDREDKVSSPLRSVKRPTQRKLEKRKEKEATAGPDWYNLPRTNLTAELKRDLQLMKMRGVLDPKRHYKTDTSKQLVAEFSEVGSIVEGPTEFFSSRVPHKQRKGTLVQEILGDRKSNDHFGTKYIDVQASKTSGKRLFYQSLKEKRHRGAHNRRS